MILTSVNKLLMSTSLKIAFLEIKDWEAEYVRNQFAGYDVLISDKTTGKINLQELKDIEVLSIFIYSAISEKVLAALPKLKFIATRSTGFDHIDLEATERRNIYIANVPAYGEHTVAEHTFALILALTHNIHRAYVRTIRGTFSFEGLQGMDLKGKVIGVIGAGYIGLYVIKFARAFGMDVLVYDVKKHPFLPEIMGYRYVAMDELLANSDVISLHVPYNPKTHHLIGHHNIGKIKRGAILINTARGALMDTTALTKALDEGILSGAGLDVLEEEGLIKEERQVLYEDTSKEKLRTAIENHILLNRENVVITPHIAFYSKEAIQRILDVTLLNIRRFLEGRPENLIAA